MTLIRVLVAGTLLATIANAQPATVFCAASANPPLVRSEGLTERLGDVVLDCSSAQPGTVVGLNLTLFLNVPVTNRLDTGTGTLDVILSVDSGTGTVTLPVRPVPLSSSSMTFLGVTFTLPSNGRSVLRVSNLRGAVSVFGLSATTPVLATIGVQGTTNVVVQASQMIVGFPQRSLLATYLETGVRCVGSPLPQVINLPNLFNGATRFFSTRVTEGFGSAFESKSALTDNGTRVVLRYSGFPANTRLFVPDVVVGANGLQQTAAGDLGGIPAGGTYQPGSGALLLARVANAAADGSGGVPVFAVPAPGSPAFTFSTVGEVALSNGAGTVTYEVIDTTPSVRETAQIPTFLGLPPVAVDAAVVAKFELTLGPTSAVSTYSPTAPILRFVNSTPPSDCPVIGDCNADYFPKLRLSGEPLVFAALHNGTPQYRYLRILNDGGGTMYWTASVSYKSGAGWLSVDGESGVGQATIRIDASPGQLPVGEYEATLAIDGGPFAGVQLVPVKMTITNIPPGPGPPPPDPTPGPSITVSAVENAARPNWESVAPGSIANVKGAGLVRLDGSTVQNPVIRFEGVAANVINATDSVVSVEVPRAMSGRSGALVTATIGNSSSAPRYVEIREISPGIFVVLNADNSFNGPSAPATAGQPIQVYTTGLLSSPAGPVTAGVHDRTVTPSYVGNVPGFIGLNQVNLTIPADLPEMQTEVIVCGAPAARPGDVACSLPAKVWLRTP